MCVVSKDKDRVHILVLVPPEARRSVDAHMDFQSVTSTHRVSAGGC